MASTKKEYEDWKQISPEFCILHKLHAEDVSRQFGGLPAPVIMVHLILFLAGIALCINKHPWWGALCFVITVLSVL